MWERLLKWKSDKDFSIFHHQWSVSKSQSVVLLCPVTVFGQCFQSVVISSRSKDRANLIDCDFLLWRLIERIISNYAFLLSHFVIRLVPMGYHFIGWFRHADLRYQIIGWFRHIGYYSILVPVFCMWLFLSMFEHIGSYVTSWVCTYLSILFEGRLSIQICLNYGNFFGVCCYLVVIHHRNLF